MPSWVCWFFCYDELSKLRESDVHFYEEHMEIFVESSKTDQLREGAWVVIARSDSKPCPVAMLERYELADLSREQDKFLFRGLVTTKKGSRLRSIRGLSYTRAREVVYTGYAGCHRPGQKAIRSAQPAIRLGISCSQCRSA